jgi:hypothetical protein
MKTMECEKIVEELREDAVQIITSIWRGINWDSVSTRRRMKIYEEYKNKIESASMVGKVTHFVEKLTEKMESTIPEQEVQTVLRIVKNVESDDLELEFLDICRSETAYLVLRMRELNDELKEGSKQQLLTGFKPEEPKEQKEIAKTTEPINEGGV